jgi:DNA-binding IclR family transcriptional regulator
MTAFHIVSQGFQSVARAAQLLEMFTVERPALSLGEITDRLGVSKPTAHRYASALRDAGLVRQADGAYTLGPRIVELASAALAGLEVIDVAGPHLVRLGEDTAQSAVLSVWDGEAPVVVRVHDAVAGRMVRIVVNTGTRLPPESAQGMVFRAFMEDAASGRARKRAEDSELKAVRRNRLAYFPDVVDGIAALAAPVMQGEEIVATMALVGTSAAIARSPRAAMSRTLVAAAEGLSQELGHVATRVGS